MESYQQRTAALGIPSPSPGIWNPDEKSIMECRNLIQLLTEKNDLLYNECRTDQSKVSHIRTIGSMLTRLNQLLIRLENRYVVAGTQDILVDSRGITYELVRACDLERICEK